jgi:hypothetical protein
VIAGRGWQPSVAIDAGPYDAVIVCWSGRCVTVLGAPRNPGEKKAGEEKPVKVPIKVQPPVKARVAVDNVVEMAVADALELAPPEVGERAGVDVPEEHFPVWYEDQEVQREPAVPTENRRTLVRTFAGTNYLDLDEHQDLFQQAERAGADILIRFT